jgi:hypothetical protein
MVIEQPPYCSFTFYEKKNELTLKNLNSAALVRKQTIPTERSPFIGEVSANF